MLDELLAPFKAAENRTGAGMSSPIPDSALALIGLLGLPDAIEFIRAFGGVKLYTPANYSRQQAQFADVVGDSLAQRLCAAHVGRGVWHVPRCLPLINAERDRRIRADYDAGGVTINELVLKYRLGHSRIEQILKTSPVATVPQPDLFAA